MAEIELSIMSRGPTTADDLRPLLEEFEVKNRTRVRLRIFEWDTAWADLVKVALYQDGPDVSEIGSTWLGSFVAMNALQQFSDREISLVGGGLPLSPPPGRVGPYRGTRWKRPSAGPSPGGRTRASCTTGAISWRWQA